MMKNSVKTVKKRKGVTGGGQGTEMKSFIVTESGTELSIHLFHNHSYTPKT